MCGELAFGHGDELGLDHLLAEGGEMVNEHLALEVVVFVLEDACLETFEPSLLLFAVLVEVHSSKILDLLYWAALARFLNSAAAASINSIIN